MSNRPLLLIGNQNYSSWSLRPWLFLRHAGVDFDFEMVPLDTPAFAERIGALSPTGKVPLLVDGERVIWDSLAICEYAREHYHIADAWPREPHARAVARSVVAEMHSGFAALRTAMPMNLRRTPAPLPEVSADVARDIARIIAFWWRRRIPVRPLRYCRCLLRAGSGAFPVVRGRARWHCARLRQQHRVAAGNARMAA